MNATWYRIEKYSDDVVPVTIERETEKSVFLEGGTRRAKHSDYEQYFTEEIDAWLVLLKRYEQQAEYHEAKLKESKTSVLKCTRTLRGLGHIIIGGEED